MSWNTVNDIDCRCAGPVVNLCLGGFVAAIRITSLLSMGMLRNTFVTSVCRFTMLHAPQSMQIKNAHAFRALLIVADENGNHMHVSVASLLCCLLTLWYMMASGCFVIHYPSLLPRVVAQQLVCCACNLHHTVMSSSIADNVMTVAECVERGASLRVSMGVAAAAALRRPY